MLPEEVTFHPRRNGFLGLGGWEAWGALEEGSRAGIRLKHTFSRLGGLVKKQTGRAASGGLKEPGLDSLGPTRPLPDSALLSLGSCDHAAGHCRLTGSKAGPKGPHPHSTSRAPEVSPPGLRRMGWRPEAGGPRFFPEARGHSLRCLAGLAVPLLKTRGPRGTGPHLQPGPEPSLQAPCPGSPAAGWTQPGCGRGQEHQGEGQHAQERGLGFGGPAWQSQRPQSLWAGEAASGPEVSGPPIQPRLPPRSGLQVLSCTPREKTLTSVGHGLGTCGIKAAYLMACPAKASLLPAHPLRQSSETCGHFI